MHFYNEFDPYAAEWLRNLIREGLIPNGVVDERSIVDVTANDLRGFTSCHFFAGIGGWPLALRLAGWPDDKPVFTGSCPCQPFSAAGKRKGTADERHLWPEFYRLIRECCPPVVFGEQVASKDGLAWYAGVHADLEASGYAVGCADLCAAGIGEKNHPSIQATRDWAYELAERLDGVDDGRAELLRDFAAWLGGISVGPPHIRQRLFWVADAGPSPSRNHESRSSVGQNQQRIEATDQLGGRGGYCRVGDAIGERLRGNAGTASGTETGGERERIVDGRGGVVPEHAGKDDWVRVVFSADCDEDGNCPKCGIDYAECGCPGPSQEDEYEYDERPDGLYARRLGVAVGTRPQGHAGDGDDGREPGRVNADANRPTAATCRGSWSDYAVWPCGDGKARRIESGLLPLVDGTAFRLADGRTREGVSRAQVLRGIGNAIVPQVAAVFIQAFMEVEQIAE